MVAFEIIIIEIQCQVEFFLEKIKNKKQHTGWESLSGMLGILYLECWKKFFRFWSFSNFQMLHRLTAQVPMNQKVLDFVAVRILYFQLMNVQLLRELLRESNFDSVKFSDANTIAFSSLAIESLSSKKKKIHLLTFPIGLQSLGNRATIWQVKKKPRASTTEKHITFIKTGPVDLSYLLMYYNFLHRKKLFLVSVL